MTIHRAHIASQLAPRGEACIREFLSIAVAEGHILTCPADTWRTLAAKYPRRRGLPAEGSAKAGLGDRVAALAQPIARALDRALGTNLAECGGCKRRQEALNRIGRFTGAEAPNPNIQAP